MLVAPAMGPTVVRSSLEVMLDSLRKKDESPEDSLPALPVRPISKGRLPSSKLSRPVNFNIEGNGLKDKQKKDHEVPKVGIFGSGKVVNVEQPEESEMPKLEGYEGSRQEEARGSEPCILPSISVGTVDGENLDFVLRKDTHKEHAVLEDLQRRVLNAEAALRIKEEENLTLKQQIQQYETRWSDYEAKMKSMEETWQKQMTSLQMSLAAAKESLAADDRASQPGRHDASSNNLVHFNSEDTMSAEFQTPEGTPAKQPRASAVVLLRNSDSMRSPVSHMVKEFEQQKQAFEDDAKFLIKVKSTAQMKPDEELQKLKVRFATWKKDYKVKLRETKVELQKLGNSELGKTRRKWWNIRSTK